MCFAGPCAGTQLHPLPIVVDRNEVYLGVASLPDPLADFEAPP